ncbi:chemokine-like protein TAFA-5 isoform X1 [Marmota marmota marmota]|uniref:chemokine-like protein TAFA-5 isoform X1 n=1 Tax=Marmota marmota marmota TaxID=9994 RepID=UPI0020926E2A|nr:chemokine-like protein TAFA-5 isoform X1 [Marmota marmota marmota]
MPSRSPGVLHSVLDVPLEPGQLAAGTCEIVTLDRDSSQPRRTIARQTARCACRKGQIAGTTRARPACVDGLLTNAALRGSRSGLGSLESPHLDPGPQPSVDYTCSLHPATVSRGPSRTASVLSILSLTDRTQEGRTWTHRWRRWAQAIQGCGARPCPPLPATLLGAGGRGWG